MPEQELDKVLDAVGTRLRGITGIHDVDVFQPQSVGAGALPRIVLRYLDSPWLISTGGRHKIQHTIQVEVIVAPLSDVRRARRKASQFVRDVKAALFTDGTGLDLIPSPNQTTVGPEGSQAIRNVKYSDNIYIASIIIFRANELTGETL
ncbi:hypothetical protein LCGC14_0816590 [marine sediment metagenome]|uniref:Tail terminator n=1 Tax=marine sediment metagenome TaxID=412755 RepID=A0A0F9Q5F8_9ZZZZ